MKISAVVGGPWESYSLRELLWRWQAITYQQAITASMVVAGLFNSHRTKKSDRVFSWIDFHPDHIQDIPQKAGKQLVADTLGWFAPGQVQWLEGYGPEVLNGK